MNGLGVSGAEVVLDGTNLTITVPGDKGDQARSLGETARLYFRPVLDRQPAGAAVPPTEVSVPPSGEVVVPPGGSPPAEQLPASEGVAPAETAPSAVPQGLSEAPKPAYTAVEAVSCSLENPEACEACQ